MEVSREILDLVPYRPGKPISEAQREFGLERVDKLASNENPLGPSPKAIEAIRQCISELHRYPDASFYQLTQKMSGRYDLDPQWISFGNGSNEIIDLLIRIYCTPGDRILTTQAAFIAYKICAQAARVQTLEVPLDDQYRMNLAAFSKELEKDTENKIKMVFLPNPNNPTGTYCGREEVENFLKQHGQREDILIVFDEAYNDFVRAFDYPDTLSYLKEYKNVVVMRTLSKVYGLAGLRIGTVFARPEVIELFNRVRNPFNVNELAQVGALAAMDDDEYLKKSQDIVWQGLDSFYLELDKLDLPWIESQANFVMFDTRRDAQEVNTALLKKGVILRPIGNYGFPNHLRMSVGLPEENERAIAALGKVLQEIPERRPLG